MAAPKEGYIKKETTMLVAVIALIIGFLGGIVFTVYKSPSGTGQQQAAAPQQAPGQPGQLTQDQARQLLALEREVQANPDNLKALIQLGHLYFDTDQPGKAVRTYEKALAIDPALAEVWTDLGVMYRRSGEPQKALEAFDKAIELKPELEQARFNKGVVYLYDLNQPDAALQTWEELLEIHPGATAPTGQPLREVIAQIRAQQQETAE